MKKFLAICLSVFLSISCFGLGSVVSAETPSSTSFNLLTEATADWTNFDNNLANWKLQYKKDGDAGWTNSNYKADKEYRMFYGADIVGQLFNDANTYWDFYNLGYFDGTVYTLSDAWTATGNGTITVDAQDFTRPYASEGTPNPMLLRITKNDTVAWAPQGADQDGWLTLGSSGTVPSFEVSVAKDDVVRFEVRNPAFPNKTYSVLGYNPKFTFTAEVPAYQKVITLIDQIGDVTLASGAKIDAAQKAYDALSADDKALVTNYSTLQTAAGTYESLVTEAKKQTHFDMATELHDGWDSFSNPGLFWSLQFSKDNGQTWSNFARRIDQYHCYFPESDFGGMGMEFGSSDAITRWDIFNTSNDDLFKTYTVAAAWTAQKAGTIKTGIATLARPYGDTTPIYIRVTKNNANAWTKGDADGWYTVTIPTSIKGYSIAVEPGDVIRFEVRADQVDSKNKTAYIDWNPVFDFTEGSATDTTTAVTTGKDVATTTTDAAVTSTKDTNNTVTTKDAKSPKTSDFSSSVMPILFCIALISVTAIAWIRPKKRVETKKVNK